MCLAVPMRPYGSCRKNGLIGTPRTAMACINYKYKYWREALSCWKLEVRCLILLVRWTQLKMKQSLHRCLKSMAIKYRFSKSICQDSNSNLDLKDGKFRLSEVLKQSPKTVKFMKSSTLGSRCLKVYKMCIDKEKEPCMKACLHLHTRIQSRMSCLSVLELCLTIKIQVDSS